MANENLTISQKAALATPVTLFSKVYESSFIASRPLAKMMIDRAQPIDFNNLTQKQQYEVDLNCRHIVPDEDLAPTYQIDDPHRNYTFAKSKVGFEWSSNTYNSVLYSGAEQYKSISDAETKGNINLEDTVREQYMQSFVNDLADFITVKAPTDEWKTGAGASGINSVYYHLSKTPTTGTINGISRATGVEVQNVAYNMLVEEGSATTVDNVLERLLKFVRKCCDRHPPLPDDFVVAPGYYFDMICDAYLKKNLGQNLYSTDAKYGVNFTKINIGGYEVRIIQDRSLAKADGCIFIRPKDWKVGLGQRNYANIEQYEGIEKINLMKKALITQDGKKYWALGQTMPGWVAETRIANSYHKFSYYFGTFLYVFGKGLRDQGVMFEL